MYREIRVVTCMNCCSIMNGYHAKCPHCAHEPTRKCHDVVCIVMVKGDVGTMCKTCKSTGGASFHKNWRDDCPSWHDFNDNNNVQVKTDDGVIHTGRVELYDEGFDGESEYPIWHVKTKTKGETIPLVDFDKWRFLLNE